MKYITLATLCVILTGCRCFCHHQEKPKYKHKLVSGLESSTKLYAEGFGPNQKTKSHDPSPAECVDLKAKLEYIIEW